MGLLPKSITSVLRSRERRLNGGASYNRCAVCRELRPQRRLHMLRQEIGELVGAAPGSRVLTLYHCRDNLDCARTANTREFWESQLR